MPSEKRARQRAGRDARRQAQAKAARRRTLIRNSVIVAVLAALVIVSVVLVTNRSKGPSTTTTTSTTAAGGVQAEQKAANQKAVAAGCPQSTKTKVNTLSWSTPPAMTIDTSKTYKATVKTTAGTFVVTLLAKTAPTTVNNFAFLAKKDYYKCNIFHRVIPGFMDQTGDPTGTGSGSPGYTFANENVPSSYATGEVAMANSGGTDTNGSQFFILTTGGASTLNGDLSSGSAYSLFGKVVKGMTVVKKINSEGSSANNGVPPKVTQRILSVKVATS
ncbi:MAG: peptidylprolyl isomerase [Acidimicrobiales bacterium]